MGKEFIDDYVKLPYDNNKFIRWINENELEMIEKKIIYISKEIIADESVNIIKYIEDKLKSETDHYKQQRDSLIKDVEKLRGEKAAIEMYLDAVKTYKPMYECVNDKYKYLTNYIKDKAIHNPSVSRYIDLVHFIDDLERDTHEG